MINQDMNETRATKLGIAADYQDNLMLAEEKASQRYAEFVAAAEERGSLADIDMLAELYKADANAVSAAKKVILSNQVASGENVDAKDAEAVYGKDSQQYLDVISNNQTNNYNALNTELATLFGNGEAKETDYDTLLSKADTMVVSGEMSKEQRGNIYSSYLTNTISKTINSTDAYSSVKSDIELLATKGIITDDQKEELVAELKKSDYNPNGFIQGGIGLKVGVTAVGSGKNSDRTKNDQNIALGVNFKATIDGKTYLVEAGNLQTWGDVGKRGKVFGKCPVGGFCYYNGELYYRETKSQVYVVRDVNKSEEGHKKADLIKALQAKTAEQ